MPDQIEKEMNEDIRNANIVDWFNYVFVKCKDIKTSFDLIEDFNDSVIEYENLKIQLQKLITMDYKGA